jgi:hypothetical protein
MKSEMYETLHALNQHFDRLSDTLEDLQKLGLLTAQFVEARRMATEEIRARINCALAQAMHEREAKDWSKFEDLRIEAAHKEIESRRQR